jgi:UDP:flavonoid glycosyltransferase YjiC (YdhE family)
MGLKKAGHSVRLAAPELFRSFVTEYGLDYSSLAGDPRDLMLSAVERAGGRPNLLRSIPVVLNYVTPIALQVIEDARQACRGADAIIHTLLTTTLGHEIALQVGVPDFSALVFPVFSPTTAFINPAFPTLPFGGWYNRLTHNLFNQAYWIGGKAAYRWTTRGRRDVYPPLTGWPFASSKGRTTPILYGFSPHVLPKPSDWGEHVHVTGFWFLPAPVDWSPPVKLTQFLQAGPPPVCISFGSIISRDAKWLTETVLEALDQSGQRGILVTGWGGLIGIDLPRSVFMLDSAPFDWLFPRSAAAVIHGGIGTTSTAMQAGIPIAVIPFTADQTFWGEQVNRLGIGCRPIPRQKITVDNLARAIREVVSDPSMRLRASQLGQRIRSEDGVSNVVKEIVGELQVPLR